MKWCSRLDSGLRRNDGTAGGFVVTPAKAGVQYAQPLDSGLRRNDGRGYRTALISAAVTGKIDVRDTA